jgi:hypothetical protein
MGYLPHGVDAVSPINIGDMKTHSKKKPPTLGEFITHVYDVCGERKASGLVQLAIKTGLVEFHGQHRFVVS